MIDHRLPEEYADLRKTVEEFAREQVAPVIGELYEREEFPYDLVARMGRMGLFGLPFPSAYGGMDGDYFALCLALEELARVDSSVDNPRLDQSSHPWARRVRLSKDPPFWAPLQRTVRHGVYHEFTKNCEVAFCQGDQPGSGPHLHPIAQDFFEQVRDVIMAQGRQLHGPDRRVAQEAVDSILVVRAGRQCGHDQNVLKCQYLAEETSNRFIELVEIVYQKCQAGPGSHRRQVHR